MFDNQPLHPIVIIVHAGTYDVYGPDDARTMFLARKLKDFGSIDVSVPDGFYQFNVRKEESGELVPELLAFDNSSS